MTIIRAKESFAYPGKDGYTRSITAGDLFDSSDDCAKGRETLFEPVEVAAARIAGEPAGKPAMEDASAEPNAKRSVSTVHPKAGEAEKSDDKPVYGDTHPPKPGARRGPKAGQ